MRIMLLAACALVAATAITASATTVTATVSDTDGQTWNIGTYTATLALPEGVFTTAVPTVNGTPVPAVVRGFIDLQGVLRGNFTDTSTLDQKDLVWVFRICPHTSAREACQTVRTPISGPSEDLTPLFTHLRAPRFHADGYAYGYLDLEVELPIPEGGLYWNVIDRCLHQWTGSRWTGCGMILQTETTPPPIAESSTIAGESVSSALNVSDPQHSAVAEASTAASDLYQAGTAINIRTGSSLTSSTSAHIIDYRNSSTLDYCRNQNNVLCHNFTALWDAPAFEPNGTILGAPRHINLNLVSTDVSAGVYETGVWTTAQAVVINHFTATESITQGLSIVHQQNGIGDGVGLYLYHNYSGCGSPMGDDEGCFAASFASLENNSQTAAPTGTVAKVATNNQYLVFTSSTNLGQGRPAIRLRNSAGTDLSILTTTVTSIDGSSATGAGTEADHFRIGVQATLTPALAIGQCQAPCSSNLPSNPAIPQQITLSIKITGGSAAGFKSGTACIVGAAHYEKILLTDVSGSAGVGNTQTITAQMWQPEKADLANVPPILVQDPNYCGLFATLDASVVTDDPNYPIRQFFPILGALDSHTLLYGFPGRFRQRLLSNEQVYDIWPQTGSVSITSDGTIATATVDRYTDWNGRVVTITGTSSFNGTFTFAAHGTLNSGLLNVYTFPITGEAVSTAQTGTASTNTGRDGLRLYAGDLIATPNNPDQTDELLEDYAGFFNSTTPWRSGDIVEFPPFWYTVAGMEYNHQICYSDNCTGYTWQYAGAGVNGTFRALDFGNSTAQNEYIGLGGHLGLPTGLSIGGPHNPVIDFSYGYNGGPSVVAGGTALKFGCPRDNDGNNCQAPYDSWELFRAPTRSDSLSFLLNVPNNSYDLNFASGLGFSFASAGFHSRGAPIFLDTAANKAWIELGAPVYGGNTSGLHFKGTSGADAWLQMFTWNSNAILTLGEVQDANINHPTPITVDSSELHVSNFYADSSAHLVNLKVGYPETPSYGVIKTTLVGGTGTEGANLGYLWVAVMPDGTAGYAGRAYNDIQFLSTPSTGLSSSVYVQISCPAAVMPWHPAGTTYEVWGYGNAGIYWRVGACPVGGSVNDTRGSTAPSGPLPAGANGQFSTGYATISAAAQFSSRDANGFDVTDTFLKRTGAGILSLGTTPGGTDGVLNAAAIAGPEHAPTGKCLTGQWSLSRDGVESFCQSSTWTPKSSTSSNPPPTSTSGAPIHTFAQVHSQEVAPGACSSWTSEPLQGLTSSMTIALSFASPIPPGWLTGQPAFADGAVTLNLCNLSGAPGSLKTTANITAQ